MKKFLSMLLLAALAVSLVCVALAAKYEPDEANKNYGTAGAYVVKSTVPEDHTYSYIYDQPSSTKGKNLGRADDGTAVTVYYTTEGIGKKGTVWAYCSCNEVEGFIRFANVVTADAYQPGPTPTPAPEATATPVPTATPAATATPKPTATATPKPTATVKPTATPTPKPTATPVPIDNPELAKMTVVKCNEWVSLRKTPSTKADRLKKVALGEEVIGYKYNDTWTACYYDDAFGYILSEYLELKK